CSQRPWRTVRPENDGLGKARRRGGLGRRRRRRRGGRWRAGRRCLRGKGNGEKKWQGGEKVSIHSSKGYRTNLAAGKLGCLAQVGRPGERPLIPDSSSCPSG